METREPLFDEMPQLDDKSRREVYEDLRKKLITSVKSYPLVQEMFAFPITNTVSIDSTDLLANLANYRITRNTHVDSIEISIDKTDRQDNPNIVLESIRFMAPKVGITDFPPMLEYHRTLKRGGSRTLKNNFPAVRRIEGFIGQMKDDLKNKSNDSH